MSDLETPLTKDTADTARDTARLGGGTTEGALATPLATAWPTMVDALLATCDSNEQLVAVKDIDTWRYLFVNVRMAELLGRSASDVVGRTDLELMGPLEAAASRAADVAASGLAAPVKTEHCIERDGNRRYFTTVRIALLPPDGSRAPYQLSVWSETTARRRQDALLRNALEELESERRKQVELRQELQGQALRDDTTGLYHHVHFQDQLKREVDLSTREHREFSLVSIALDPLDERALAAGEQGRLKVLEALGRLLLGNTRAMDASCWLDQEHFAVLLSGVGLATAHSRMDGLRRQCAAQVVLQDDVELGFTVSIGIASFPHTASTQEELVEAADKALALARKRGNHVSLASITLA